MIDYDEIDREIKRLEAGHTTYSSCEKLAVLYAVSNGRKSPDRAYDQSYSYAAEEQKKPPLSDFATAAGSVSQERLIEILDEHMQAIQAIYPKEYSYIMAKLKE